jgi:predicted enzyme related to lactoylglutathione lyase
MPTRLSHVVVDAVDPPSIARFWSRLLDWPIVLEDPDEVYLEKDGPGVTFVPVSEPKVTKNRVHFDLASSSEADQATTVARAVALGARRIDIGQGADARFVVMADPDGNEFCVLEPRPEFTGTGAIAAIVQDCGDPAALAPFWSAATGWPIVAQSPTYVFLRAPDGGGPFLALVRVDEPKTAKHRVHLDVRPYAGDDHAAEVDRLLSLGATRADIGQGDVPWVVLADPEGNEVCVLTPR